MSENAVVDANVLVVALSYIWKGLTVLLIPIVWLFVGRVQKDFKAVNDRIGKCEEGHITVKEMELKDELSKEKNDRMISAIERLEKCAEKQEKS